jgi:hypothetical protein
MAGVTLGSVIEEESAVSMDLDRLAESDSFGPSAPQTFRYFRSIDEASTAIALWDRSHSFSSWWSRAGNLRRYE